MRPDRARAGAPTGMEGAEENSLFARLLLFPHYRAASSDGLVIGNLQ
jgi:hypothetical protein